MLAPLVRIPPAAMLTVLLALSSLAAHGAEPAPGVASRLEQARAAFLRSDVTMIARQFPNDAPVLLTLPGIAAGTLVGPGQLRVYVEQLTRDHATVGFELVSTEPSQSDGWNATVYAYVRWRSVDRRTGRLEALTLRLSLRPSAEADWRIVSMTTVR